MLSPSDMRNIDLPYITKKLVRFGNSVSFLKKYKLVIINGLVALDKFFDADM